MGKRSGTETVVEIMLAFLAQGTWTQADLARRVGISAEAVRRTLHEMTDKGIPLERQEDAPHVFWSVPRRWFPGGIVLRAGDAEELLRQLARAPRSKRHRTACRRPRRDTTLKGWELELLAQLAGRARRPVLASPTAH